MKANRTGHTRESNVDKVGIFVWSAPNSVTRTKKQFLTDVATTSSVTCSRHDVINGHCCRCTPRTLGWISGKVGLVTVADYRRLNVHHLTSKTSIESEVLTDWIRSSTTTEQWSSFYTNTCLLLLSRLVLLSSDFKQLFWSLLVFVMLRFMRQ